MANTEVKILLENIIIFYFIVLFQLTSWNGDEQKLSPKFN